ncbi:hypothetical protein CVT25_009108 [Psilocybe cyanescens]|uniref:Uncharacterized protein n=1 Tax=Psilocybe cyanescens TaxID=93625 RepID=A0A409VNG4_PSICY|nr:hypothetical protein CVT25_009108 [Psilocybe cyanescens]
MPSRQPSLLRYQALTYPIVGNQEATEATDPDIFSYTALQCNDGGAYDDISQLVLKASAEMKMQ